LSRDVPEGSKKLTYKGYLFHVFPEVYEPSDDTFLMGGCLEVKEGSRVLDLGTGCGILGILAAERAERVIGIDLNPHAVRCAKANAKTNGVEGKMDLVLGDLFQPLKPDEKFDLILFNPPYLPTPEREGKRSWLEKAWSGGPSGRRVIDRFLFEAPRHLKEGGIILLLQSSLSSAKKTLRVLEKAGLKPKVVNKIIFPFETIFLLRATKTAERTKEAYRRQKNPTLFA